MFYSLTQEERDEIKMAESALRVLLDADPDIAIAELKNARQHMLLLCVKLGKKMGRL